MGLGLAALPVDARRPGIIGHLEVGREPAEGATCPRRSGAPPPPHLSPPLPPPARPSGPAAAPSLPGMPPSRPLSELPSHQLCLLLAGTGLGRRLALGSVLETSLGGGRGSWLSPSCSRPHLPTHVSRGAFRTSAGPPSRDPPSRDGPSAGHGHCGAEMEAGWDQQPKRLHRVCVHACAHVCLCECPQVSMCAPACSGA